MTIHLKYDNIVMYEKNQGILPCMKDTTREIRRTLCHYYRRLSWESSRE